LSSDSFAAKIGKAGERVRNLNAGGL
jgi:hypothetical protein